MAKFVVSNIELIKKDYLVDAYSIEAAQEKAHLQPPRIRVSLGEITHSVTSINEYEYNQKWKSQPDYNEGHDLLSKVEDGPPDQRELFELEPEIFKDDDSYEIFRDE